MSHDAALVAHADLVAAATGSALHVGPLEREIGSPPRCLVTLLVAGAPPPIPELAAATAQLYADVEAWAQRYGETAGLELELCFPEDFPLAMPRLRLLRPILVRGTGGVNCGAFITPELMPDGWHPSSNATDLARIVRTCLARWLARVDMSTSAAYPVRAFEAAAHRISLRRDPSLLHPQRFRRVMTVCSGGFAQSVMGQRIPVGFEHGNRALLPSSTLELLARAELKDMARTEAEHPTIFGRRTGDVGAAEEEPASFVAESAMLFELVSALRFPVYVGVREFTVSDDRIIVVPGAVLAAMGVPEASDVTVSRVALPATASLTLQPHSATALDAWMAARGGSDSSDALHRDFLEASLRNYACLAAGEVIQCRASGGAGGDVATARGGGERAGTAQGRRGGGAGATTLPPDVLAALLDAGEDVSEYFTDDNGGTARSNDVVGTAHFDDAGDQAVTVAYTVVDVAPAGAPAVALFSLYSSSVPISLLPAVDEHTLLPPRAPRHAIDALTTAPTTAAHAEGATARANEIQAVQLSGTTAAALPIDNLPTPPSAVQTVPIDERRRRAAAAAAARAAAAAAENNQA